jgi:hypothetical protein
LRYATNIQVQDSGFTGAGPLSSVSCPTTTLAPGTTATCTATYTVTQLALVNDDLSNSAIAVGSGVGGAQIASNQSSVTLTEPSVSLASTGVPSEFYLILAGLLVGLGALLLLAGRRRSVRV